MQCAAPHVDGPAVSVLEEEHGSLLAGASSRPGSSWGVCLATAEATLLMLTVAEAAGLAWLHALGLTPGGSLGLVGVAVASVVAFSLLALLGLRCPLLRRLALATFCVLLLSYGQVVWLPILGALGVPAAAVPHVMEANTPLKAGLVTAAAAVASRR